MLQRYSERRQPHGSRPFHDLPGTIPPFHHSNHETVKGGTAFGVIPATSIFGNGR